jgi:hypothetical protein
MLDESMAAELEGSTLLDADGHEVGEIAHVFTFPGDDRPALASVAVGGRHLLVPLDETDIDADHVAVHYSADVIEDAPDAPDDEVTADEADAVYEHYGIALPDDAGAALDDEDEPTTSLDAMRDDEHADDLDDEDDE